MKTECKESGKHEAVSCFPLSVFRRVTASGFWTFASVECYIIFETEHQKHFTHSEIRGVTLCLPRNQPPRTPRANISFS
jgi:hypothetical protein